MEWILVTNKTEYPKDRPILVQWEQHMCMMEFDSDERIFVIASHPANHMHMKIMKASDLRKITHWVDLPRSPLRSSKMKYDRDDNRGKYKIEQEKLPLVQGIL